MIEQPARRDLRLVPSALAVWGTTLVGMYGGHHAAILVGIVACLLVIGCGLRAWHRFPLARRMMAGVLAVGALTITASIGIALRVQHTSGHELRAAAERGAEALVRLRLTEDPVRLSSAGYAGSPDDGRL